MHNEGEINCQTLKKKDSFWNNIPPGKCDPYSEFITVITVITVPQSVVESSE